MAVLDSAHTGA